MLELKVGVLISYDYNLLRHSLPRYYDYVNKIVLAIDKNRKTWSGSSFSVDNEFFEWIRKTDLQDKISIYEDDFYLPSLSSIENDSRERTLLGKYMGQGGWHIQIDVDEYFIDFPSFIEKLRKIEQQDSEDVTVSLRWITLFKQCKNGYLYIDSNESFPVATTQPAYIAARVTRNKNTVVLDDKVIHQSWARTPEEIWQKINSWGHTTDFNANSYFNLWKAIDENNYKFLKDFHPLTPKTWPILKYSDATTITEFITQIEIGLLQNSTKKFYQGFMKNLWLPAIFRKSDKLKSQ